MEPLDTGVAAVAAVAAAAPNGFVGRTALMKCCYLLQTLYQVPLGYRFTLYSYGPFAKEVLTDLAEAEVMGLVEETVVQYPSSYGFQIRCPAGSLGKGEGQDWFSQEYGEKVRAVMQEFGGRTAADLELLSTVVFAYKESAADSVPVCRGHLEEMVAKIKPKFAGAEVSDATTQLVTGGHLPDLGDC